MFGNVSFPSYILFYTYIYILFHTWRMFHYGYAIKCDCVSVVECSYMCIMEFQHISATLFESSWIIITSIDGLVEEDPLFDLHVLLILILWIFIYGDILRPSCILLLLLWKYSKIVLSLRVKKYEILQEFLNVFDNPCDVDAKHASMQKEIIISNFWNENIDINIK